MAENREAETYSFELRSGATIAGVVAALPAGKIGLWAGSNIMSEVIGDEAKAGIEEARVTHNEEALNEHTAEMLAYIVGTAAITLVAMTTAYGFVKNRALKNWSSLRSQNAVPAEEGGEN